MDITAVIIALVFFGLLGAAVYFFLIEPKNKRPENNTEKKQEIALIASFQKKISAHEERIKQIENDCQTARSELRQTQEREKTLLKEKSQNAFDAEQYEKFKKDHQTLKKEVTVKEEMLEQEITQKRQATADLTQLRQDAEVLKKKIAESEDGLRKAQATMEILTKELNLAKKTVEEQKKIVREHMENKAGGEWVSRLEFNKVEQELREKGALIQKMLAVKKEEGPP